MATTNDGDLVTPFLGTQSCAPQVGTCSSYLCRRPVEADSLCERCLRKVTLVDVEWLSGGEARVTWAWDHSSRTGADGHEGFTSVSVVWVDRCPADRSVGIDSPYYEVNSDLPVEVDELVAERAAERDSEGPDYDEDRDDRWRDDDDRFERHDNAGEVL